MQCFHPKGFQIACDKCGKTFKVGGKSVFSSVEAVVEAAKEQGWKSLKARVWDICPVCRRNHRD